MRNFKDKTITRLCNLLNCFEDLGFLTDEDRDEYRCIMDDYSEGCYEERKIEEAASEPKRYSNCVVYRDKEDGEVIVEAYPNDRADDMMRDVSKVICFSDCDDTIEILHVIFNGQILNVLHLLYNSVHILLKSLYHFLVFKGFLRCCIAV